MSDKTKGLYQKYSVSRNDGKEISQGCFVLELKDPKARKAILAYAEEVEKEGLNKELAYDLKQWVGRYQKVESNKDVKLFELITLIPDDKILDQDSLYVVPPDDVEEYAQPNDLRLPGVLSVDMTLYNENLKQKKEQVKNEPEDPLIGFVAEGIVKNFEESEYTDFERYWVENKESYESKFGDRCEDIVQKVRTEVQNKSPNQTN